MNSLESHIRDVVKASSLDYAEQLSMTSTLLAAVRADGAAQRARVQDLLDTIALYKTAAVREGQTNFRTTASRVSGMRGADDAVSETDDGGVHYRAAEDRAMAIGTRAASTRGGFEMLSDEERRLLQRARLPVTRAAWDQYWTDVRNCDRYYPRFRRCDR